MELEDGKAEEKRFAVHVDGIAIPGFSSLKEAEKEIRRRPNWQKRGAVATQLYAKPIGDIYQSG